MMTEQLMYLLSNIAIIIGGIVCVAIGWILLFYYGKAWLVASGKAAWQCAVAVIAGAFLLIVGLFVLAIA